MKVKLYPYELKINSYRIYILRIGFTGGALAQAWQVRRSTNASTASRFAQQSDGSAANGCCVPTKHRISQSPSEDVSKQLKIHKTKRKNIEEWAPHIRRVSCVPGTQCVRRGRDRPSRAGGRRETGGIRFAVELASRPRRWAARECASE